MTEKKQTVEDYFKVFRRYAETKGLIFHSEKNMVKALIEGLFANKQRYGYPSCPCRLATGQLDDDRDIICPCDYSIHDIEEYGKCYCNLFVSEDFADGNIKDVFVPERRPAEKIK